MLSWTDEEGLDLRHVKKKELAIKTSSAGAEISDSPLKGGLRKGWTE